MTSRDWFGLSLRLFGVWHLSTAAHYLVNSLEMRLFPSTASPFSTDTGDSWYLFYCVAYGVIGISFILGANPLTRFAYPRAVDEVSEQVSTDQASSADT